MDQYGKIFVVVAVLTVILVGVFVYMFSIDQKVRKLEKEVKEKETSKLK